MKKEIWKDIEGYEGIYQVSSLGRVKSLPKQCGFYYKYTEKILNGFIKSNGYHSVDLYKDEKRKKFHIHRLVAIAFIPNPENKPEINHKDENKSNNCANNLEWVTSKENKNYGTHNEKVRAKNINHPNKSRVVVQYDLFGNFVKIYPSAKEAFRQTGIESTSIIRNCRHRGVETCKGFVWKYIEETDLYIQNKYKNEVCNF